MKKREEEIKKYVPKAYQGSALNSSKMELKTLEAELKAAKIEAVGDTKLGSEGFEGVVIFLSSKLSRDIHHGFEHVWIHTST